MSNVGVGYGVLINNTTGSFNTVVGASSGNIISTGSHNVIVGYFTGNATTTGSNNIYIDGSSTLTPANESNAIRIGSSQTSCFIKGISGNTIIVGSAVSISAAGQLGVVVSSRRFKHDINEMGNYSENIYDLNPVSFIYNSDETDTTQFGLIAEEVDKVLPQLVVKDEAGSPYTVRYELLPVLLLNEIKKQKVDLEEQKQDISMLKNIVAKLQQKLQQCMTKA